MQCPNESENFGYDRRPAARLNIESGANSEPGLCAARQNGGARKSTAVNKSDKMQAGNPPIVAAKAFAVEFCGSMPARYIRIVTDRVQAHRISIAPRTAKHRCIEIARTA